jgi:Superfamily I DNA and RNA helicases
MRSSNRIFPNWAQIEAQYNPLTEGERALLEYFDDNLPRDDKWKDGDKLVDYHGWLIFSQPYLDGMRPDVVIFNPFIGATIYEVKDWNLALYSISDGSIYVSDGNNRHEVLSPIIQVKHYKENLISKLIPNIGEFIDNEHKAFGLIKTGLYFHNSTTQNCLNFLKQLDPVVDKPYFHCFGNDFIRVSGYEKDVVPNYDIYSSNYWESSWNSEILFWLKPPFHSLEQCTMLKLRGNQVKIAEPQSGHYRVRGVAGSGKTQVLAYRAAKLASQGKNVLILTFNITLWHYIKDMIARAPFEFDWSRITFDNFHNFCKNILYKLNTNWPHCDGANDVFFKEVVPEEVKKVISRNGADFHIYDAILIDEGQDYEFEWYDLLNRYFLTGNDEMVVVCDKRQNIYGRDLNWLDKTVTKSGLEKFGDWIRLSISYRIPPQVMRMANDFAETFKLDMEIKGENMDMDPTLPNMSSIVIWMNIGTTEWPDYLIAAYDLLKEQGESASDIVMLLPSHLIGIKAVKLFKERKSMSVNHIFGQLVIDQEGNKKEIESHHHKMSFWMGDGRLKMCTVHSYKGWESQDVVILIPNNTELVYDLRTDALHNEERINWDSLLYTAMTRTRHNLIILNECPKYNSFGEKYQPSMNT